jgi:pyochelin biosynthetic protein PchC
VICLPPAGSSATFYHRWAAHLPPSIAMAAVQYPGRENRLSEAALDDLHDLADQAAMAVAPFMDVPLALFGHSLGAAVAYEMALRLPAPAVLFVSGCPAPQVQAIRPRKRWDDESIVADLLRLGGPNHAALTHPALRSLLLTALRADYELGERYMPASGVMLDCAVVAIHGRHDSEVTPEEMQEWSSTTRGPFERVEVGGDHFFPLTLAREIVALVSDTLATHRGRR